MFETVNRRVPINDMTFSSAAKTIKRRSLFSCSLYLFLSIGSITVTHKAYSQTWEDPRERFGQSWKCGRMSAENPAYDLCKACDASGGRFLWRLPDRFQGKCERTIGATPADERRGGSDTIHKAKPETTRYKQHYDELREEAEKALAKMRSANTESEFDEALDMALQCASKSELVLRTMLLAEDVTYEKKVRYINNYCNGLYFKNAISVAIERANQDKVYWKKWREKFEEKGPGWRLRLADLAIGQAYRQLGSGKGRSEWLLNQISERGTVAIRKDTEVSVKKGYDFDDHFAGLKASQEYQAKAYSDLEDIQKEHKRFYAQWRDCEKKQGRLVKDIESGPVNNAGLICTVKEIPHQEIDEEIRKFEEEVGKPCEDPCSYRYR